LVEARIRWRERHTMTFEHDESADVLWVSISEPSSLCVYVEGQTPASFYV